MLVISVNVFASNEILIKYKKTKISLFDYTILSDKNIESLRNVIIQAYPGVKFNLKGIKLCNLIKLPSTDTVKIKIIAKDKFFIFVSKKEIKDCHDSSIIPYLVVQNKEHFWPKIDGNHEEVGVFSLVWMGKNSSKISKEKWVRNIASIEVQSKPQQRDIIILPKNANDREKQGFKIFEDNCSSCHSLNLVGQLEIGPDLNYPMNPLEYFSDKMFKKFIRNPQAVRYFKNAKMEGFDIRSRLVKH